MAKVPNCNHYSEFLKMYLKAPGTRFEAKNWVCVSGPQVPWRDFFKNPVKIWVWAIYSK
jgi:hypothetical protein